MNTDDLRLPWHRETVGHASTRQIADKVLRNLRATERLTGVPMTDATWIYDAEGYIVAFVGNGPRQTENADAIIEAVTALNAAAQEGRNVLPDATDDQASTIEQWASKLLGITR